MHWAVAGPGRGLDRADRQGQAKCPWIADEVLASTRLPLFMFRRSEGPGNVLPKGSLEPAIPSAARAPLRPSPETDIRERD
ncbi:hypothetical protein ColTof4_11496 [Colletotrichum tofieldiae]|nr:hypothetical protein ColTof3_04684 [Colletotrichum tofieldiae]GKT79073.1 hypothetical protein ColTof4_11496 [Colletotrichum tofieldiae]